MGGHAGAQEDPDKPTGDGHRLPDYYAETGDQAALRAAAAACEGAPERPPPGACFRQASGRVHELTGLSRPPSPAQRPTR